MEDTLFIEFDKYVDGYIHRFYVETTRPQLDEDIAHLTSIGCDVQRYVRWSDYLQENF